MIDIKDNDVSRPALCFWFHRWTKWIDLRELEMTNVITKASRPVLMQERRCAKCNECERRVVTY